MKEILNTSAMPLRIPLPGGKTLHLGPKKVAQIADNATEHPAIQKLIKDGSVKVLGEGERHESLGEPGNSTAHAQEYAKPTFKRGHGVR
jgi:hypothetical protein